MGSDPMVNSNFSVDACAAGLLSLFCACKCARKNIGTAVAALSRDVAQGCGLGFQEFFGVTESNALDFGSYRPLGVFSKPNFGEPSRAA